MRRREFVKSTVVAAAVGGIGATRRAAAEEGEKEAVLKLGSQISRLPGKSIRDKVLKLEEWGGVGLELHGAPADKVKEIREALKGTQVKISALCWGSHGGDLVSLDAEKRKKGVEDMKKALEVSGELGANGAIFVPCFNGQSDLKPPELDKVMLDMLPELGDYAQKHNTRVLLEPLNKKETFYLNRLEQAVALCEKQNDPGICMMGDFYHMGLEEKDDDAAFVTAGKWLRHVHLGASQQRVLPGQAEHSFVEGFRGLKRIGYQQYCSLECGVRGDANVEIPKSFRFLEQQWEAAKV